MSAINDALDTFRVGLFITDECNIRCSHCWFDSGPNRKTRMRLKEAINYIDQARRIPTVEWISFTGGEPFLVPEMLLNLVGYASERGLHTECVTNCFWAETEEKAEKQLRELVDAGLYVINISVDDFHQQYIPFERVRNCYEASKRLALRVVIMCTVARSSRLRINEVAMRLDYEGIRIIGEKKKSPVSALAMETGFVPVGRGAEIPKEEWLIGYSPIEGPCRAVLQDIGIASSGRVLPCCSAASLVEDAALGNANEKSLAELIEAASKQPLFKILSSKGPTGLSDLLDAKHQDRYVNQCHLCYEMLTDARLSQVLEDF